MSRGHVRDALRRIGFERDYGPLETGQTIDRVISQWVAASSGARYSALKAGAVPAPLFQKFSPTENTIVGLSSSGLKT